MIITGHTTQSKTQAPAPERRPKLKGPFTVDGKQFDTIKELAKYKGMKRVTLSWRIHHWGFDVALSRKVKPYGTKAMEVEE